MRLLRRTAPLMVAALAAFAVTAATASAGSAGPAAPEPEGHVVSVAKKPVAGTYLVTLAAGRQAVASAAATEKAASALADRYDGRLGAVLTKTMRGFVVRDLSEQQARRLAAHPDVAEVRQSGTARIGTANGPGGTQNNPQNWGLDRIDQRDRPLDSKYTYPNDGAGVTAYIVDTGIRYTHQEFEGRAKFGADFHATPNQGNDCHNHGTHVAGIVAGSTRGVAKKTNLVSVRILGCDGFGVDADLVEAAEWIATNAVKPAVVNLSVYTDDPDIAVSAIRGSIVNAGVQWSLITGNNGGNACSYGPGGQMTEALTVANATNQDTRASDSNAGSCMDLWAPGSGISSAFRGSDSAYGNLSGTSMAAPHVAGAMALRLHEAPSSTPAQLHQWVMDNASTGKMSGIPSDAPNKLLHVPNTPPATDDFSMAANPAAVSVDPGSSVSTTVSTTVTRGAAQTVQLSATGLPSGVTASFDPASVTAGNSSRLTLTAAASASPTRATVTVTGKGTVTRTTSVGLTVNGDIPDDYSLSTDPSSGTVAAGNSITTTVRATATSVAPADTGQSKTAMREESSAGPGAGVGVVGGTLTTVSKYPFIISQHRVGGARPTEQSCTGSVVAPRKVLIAAHCKFAAGEKYLVYGRDDLADTSKGVRIGIQEYLTHPSYNANDGWRTGFDVAVITTTADIPTPAGMAYPSVAKSGDTLALGTRGTAIGYGKSDSQDAERNTKLYEAVLPTVDGQNCGSYSGHFDDRYMMCSGFASGGPSLCQGDSGGPYLHNGKIYGVFSWLRTDCATYQAHGKLWGVMGDWANEQLGTTEPPTGEVTLTATGLPSGTTASFSPSKIDLGGSAQLTISTSASTPAGDYTITINGTRDSVTRQTTYRLTVTSGGSTTLALANPGTQTSVKGRPVNLQLKATGGTGSYRFTATGLPTGLTLNQSTGLISGTPTVAANYRPAVKVTDTSGATASTTFYWFIFPY